MGLKQITEIEPMTIDRLYKEYGKRVYVHPYYRVEKILFIKNGCCRDLPVLLTTNIRPDGLTNYSCQCACGGWCTTGADTAAGAINEYERMTRECRRFWR